MDDSTVVGVWDKISLYCMNHKQPRLMKLVSNMEMIKTPFYGCTKYFPDEKEESEPPCPNRLNIDDYQGIVLAFSDIVAEEGPLNDLTNLSFTYRGTRQKIKVTILKYSATEIRLGILNTTVMGGR